MKIEIYFNETDDKETLLEKLQRGLNKRISFSKDEKQDISIEERGVQVTDDVGHTVKISARGMEFNEKNKTVNLNEFDMLNPEELDTYNSFISNGIEHADAIEMTQTVKLLKHIAYLPESGIEESARDIRHAVGDALKSIHDRVNGKERDDITMIKMKQLGTLLNGIVELFQDSRSEEDIMDSIQERIGKIKDGYESLAKTIVCSDAVSDYNKNCDCESCSDEDLDKAVELLELYDFPLGLFEWSNMMNKKYLDELNQNGELSLPSLRELNVKFPDFLEVTKLDVDEMSWYLNNKLCDHG